MVADENHLGTIRMSRLEVGNPLPVALDDGRLGLQHHEVGGESREALGKIFRRPFLGNAIQPCDLVPGLLQHRGRGGGHNREDVSGA